jgi:glycosyltransferase involved in cell wall biosynthesis
MGNSSLVSVIIAVYNGERYLAEAIDTVLAQTYQPIEIIVIDDGSTDNSAPVAQQFAQRIRYFYQPNAGLGAARNAGVEVSQGDYLSFLDADDLWIENKIALQMALFQSNPEADLVFGHVQQFISPELDEAKQSTIYCPPEKMPGYIAGTMVIKRKSFLQAGPFETNWQIGEFVQWYIKIKEKRLKSLMLSEVVLKRRLHTDNMGIRDRDSRIDYVRIMKASLDRRRAAGQTGHNR